MLHVGNISNKNVYMFAFYCHFFFASRLSNVANAVMKKVVFIAILLTI